MATQPSSESNAPAAPSQPPRLLDQLFTALRAANYGPKNAERYVECCRQFILCHGKRHPRDLGAAEVQRFLDHLAVEQKLAVAWQHEAAGALAFLYRQVLGLERGLPEVGRVRSDFQQPSVPGQNSEAEKNQSGGKAPQSKVENQSGGKEPQSKGPKLLDRARAVLRGRRYSLRTEECYVEWMRRYILFHNKRHPLEMGGLEVEEFLTHLAVDGHVSISTQAQALHALLFLYQQVLEVELPLIRAIKSQRPRRLPVVMSKPEVRQVLEAIDGYGGLYQLMGRLMYGTGMRLLEGRRLHDKSPGFSGRSNAGGNGGGGGGESGDQWAVGSRQRAVGRSSREWAVGSGQWAGAVGSGQGAELDCIGLRGEPSTKRGWWANGKVAKRWQGCQKVAALAFQGCQKLATLPGSVCSKSGIVVLSRNWQP